MTYQFSDMPRFIETICFEEGRYPLLDLHQQRVDKAFLNHFPGVEPHDLKKTLPWPDYHERYKVRIVYNVDQVDIEFSLHQPRLLEKVKLIKNDHIDYAHKYEERSELQTLFDQRGEADEILIIKKGMVTDSFYANPVFWDGGGWYTPSTYLLNGVRRQHLLHTGKVLERSISEQDLFSFEKVSLVNALVDLGESEIAINHIEKP